MGLVSDAGDDGNKSCLSGLCRSFQKDTVTLNIEEGQEGKKKGKKNFLAGITFTQSRANEDWKRKGDIIKRMRI